ncbi:3,4-dihydroxy-2-butanone-4-phosphate synthase [Granulosicoccus sp.]|nr:3,4-dihydroxy-2-butanone-4-phosphate synthase [Granulosicoccus sp.]MDB4222384.1 3,4-dihydroxy-2-butanone-4-phosphate synthase [Granulosicoccus sp.]
MSKSVLSPIEDALDAYRSGQMVIIVDDEDRENEGDVVLAAEFATPETINFMVTHARGLVCLAMRGSLLDRLKVPMMVPQSQNRSGFGTGFTISVEAINGVSTGISAEDRSHTIRTLINPNTTPDDIAMPGHIFPLRARDGGVLERRGQTEASVDMSALAGLTPAGIICEVMREDGTMMRLEELGEFGKEHNLHVISVEQIANYRLTLGQGNMATAVVPDASDVKVEDNLVNEIGRSQLPTNYGQFDVIVYRDQQGFEHTALVKGDVAGTTPLIRLHSECLTGDAFGSLRCDCGPQLHTAMERVEEQDNGIILYLRQEGRGIGLGNKIRAYALQDNGRDTVEANHELGFPADARSYDVAAAILTELNVSSVKLLSNNPAKREALQGLGIDVVERVPLVIDAQVHNHHYLQTKADRMGHNYKSDDA